MNFKKEIETQFFLQLNKKYNISSLFSLHIFRAECIKQLWAYLKKHELQDPENKQYFTPDKKMAKIFGTDKLRGFGMAKFLNAHLTKLD